MTMKEGRSSFGNYIKHHYYLRALWPATPAISVLMQGAILGYIEPPTQPTLTNSALTNGRNH